MSSINILLVVVTIQRPPLINLVCCLQFLLFPLASLKVMSSHVNKSLDPRYHHHRQRHKLQGNVDARSGRRRLTGRFSTQSRTFGCFWKIQTRKIREEKKFGVQKHEHSNLFYHLVHSDSVFAQPRTSILFSFAFICPPLFLLNSPQSWTYLVDGKGPALQLWDVSGGVVQPEGPTGDVTWHPRPQTMKRVVAGCCCFFWGESAKMQYLVTSASSLDFPFASPWLC